MNGPEKQQCDCWAQKVPTWSEIGKVVCLHAVFSKGLKAWGEQEGDEVENFWWLCGEVEGERNDYKDKSGI